MADASAPIGRKFARVALSGGEQKRRRRLQTSYATHHVTSLIEQLEALRSLGTLASRCFSRIVRRRSRPRLDLSLPSESLETELRADCGRGGRRRRIFNLYRDAIRRAVIIFLLGLRSAARPSRVSPASFGRREGFFSRPESVMLRRLHVIRGVRASGLVSSVLRGLVRHIHS